MAISPPSPPGQIKINPGQAPSRAAAGRGEGTEGLGTEQRFLPTLRSPVGAAGAPPGPFLVRREAEGNRRSPGARQGGRARLGAGSSAGSQRGWQR